MFGGQSENVAVEVLGHILSGSDTARHALTQVLRPSRAAVDEITQVHTQVIGRDRSRPDLVGLDRDGNERVLIEAKFWAGLTKNQPVAYLERLPVAEPSVLLVVAPASRFESLWTELYQRVSEGMPNVELGSPHKESELWSTTTGGARRLVLISWKSLLNLMADGAAGSAEPYARYEIEQLMDLAEQQDEERFLPLRPDELAPAFPRRVCALRRLVDDAADRVSAGGRPDTEKHKVTSQEWGYGRYLTLAGEYTWFGIDFVDWAQFGATPLWLWFPKERTTERVTRALQPLSQCNPPKVRSWPDGLCVPIEVPLGVEYDEALDGVVTRLEEVMELIRRAGKITKETIEEPTHG